MSQQDPRFTFVVDLRSDGPALTPTLKSLIAQDLGFTEHVEIVLVAPEGTERLSALRDRYPENIRLVGTPSSSSEAQRFWWRTGLRAARGEFVSFIGVEALFGPESLTAVRDLASAPAAAEVAVFAVLPMAGTPLAPALGYADLPPRDRVVDLSEHPNAVPVSLAGLIFRADALRHVLMANAGDETVLGATTEIPDEALLILTALATHGFRLGLAARPGARVEAAVRSDERLLPDAERARIEQVCAFFEAAAARGPLHPALRSAMLLLFRIRLVRVSDRWFSDADDARAFKTRIRELLNRLTPAELHDAIWLDKPHLKYLLASAVFLDRPWSLDQEGRILARGERIFDAADLPLEVMRVNARPGEIELEVIFHDFFTGDLELRLVSSTGAIAAAVEEDRGESPKQRTAEQYASLAHYRRFILPATPGTSWRFVYTSTSFAAPIPVTGVAHHAKTAFGRDPERRIVFGDRYRLSYGPASGYTILAGRGSRLRYKFRRAREYAREFRVKPWSLLASSSRSELILINDRARYGNDSGEALFRYIQEHRPELRRRTWFVLDPAAPAYAELAKTGRVIRPLTFAHRRAFLNARLHLSSQAPAHYNSPWSGKETSSLSDFADPTFIWLRHGVTMNSVDHVYNRFNNNLDGIVASTRYEADYLLRPGSFFTERSVVASGLPRFDRLHDRSAQQPRASLLYMPTWRAWLAGDPHPDGYRLPVPGFAESDYFEQQRRLMTDPEIAEALRDANAQFEFLVHPVMAGYQSLYESLASETVVVRDPTSSSYADLFARGAGMITDYSSVFVDFSYMGKPVVFDQTDVARFRDGHYQKGLFDYETQAPGPVVSGFDALKRATLELIRSGFTVAPEYAPRLDGFFLHHDGSNSARALDAAIEIDVRRRGRAF